MATNKPESRKTHIVRIFGTNESDDILPDIWADLERMDGTFSRTNTTIRQEDVMGQKVVGKFRWLDDPNADDYNPDGNPAHTIKLVKLCSPDEDDLENPSEWIPVPVVTRTRLKASDQDIKNRYNKLDSDNLTSRTVEVRRIVHYDTNIDADAQAAADRGDKTFVVASEDYSKDDATKDDGQYVEHEIIKTYVARTEGYYSQRIKISLQNDYLIDEAEDATLEITGADGFNPPYRLDPYQNIVNVQFKKGLPKYSVVSGWAGITNVMLFYIEEDSQTLQTVSLDDPLGFSGYPALVGPSDIPSPITSFAHTPGGDFKGISKLTVSGNLYPVGQFSGTPPAPLDTSAFMFVDYKGEEVLDYAALPDKGLLVNGLWGKVGGVRKYEGDTLIWSRDFNTVYEILPGYRVLGRGGPGTDTGFGVYTLSPEDGSILTSVLMGSGGLSSDLSIYDTSSDGSTYERQRIVLPGDANHTSYHQIIHRKYNDKGVVQWSRTYANAPGDSSDQQFDSGTQIGVVESKQGRVYVLTHDVSPEVLVFHSDDLGNTYKYDSLLKILDGETGEIVQTINWGTNIPGYTDDSASPTSITAHGQDPNSFTMIGVMDRFPS